MTFTAQILTLYPEMFPGPLGVSLAGRALAEGKWACDPIQIRDFAADKHRTVDDTPARNTIPAPTCWARRWIMRWTSGPTCRCWR